MTNWTASGIPIEGEHHVQLPNRRQPLDLNAVRMPHCLGQIVGRLQTIPCAGSTAERNLPTTLRHLPIQFSEPSFPPSADSTPLADVTGSARLIQTSAG